MARPVIGICTALERASWTVWEREAYLLSRTYVDTVQEAGGLAFMLPPDGAFADPEEAAAALAPLDGLVLAGGADVDPASYGAERHRCTSGTWPERDAAELALAQAAMARDLPFLGICRGMQLLNVARGGTLVQHLPDDVGHTDHRRHLGSFDDADHDVRLERARRSRGGDRAARRPLRPRRPVASRGRPALGGRGGARGRRASGG
jgi:putative glutamine amidotransferase